MVTKKLFSSEWCEASKELWNQVAYPKLKAPEKFTYVIQWELADGGAMSQAKLVEGRCVSWDVGTPDPDPAFIAVATAENWKKLGEGNLDPIGALASKRLHLKRGPVAVAINESDAFKTIIRDLMAQDGIDWEYVTQS